MKTINLFADCLLLFTSLYTKDFQIPKDYKLKVAADYVKYKPDIIAAAKWLQAKPIDEQNEKRKHVSAFVVSWVNGSPSVNVKLNKTIIELEKKRNVGAFFCGLCIIHS